MVYRELGCSFLQAVYQECLEIEFTGQGIPFVPQAELGLTYKDRGLKQKYFCRFHLHREDYHRGQGRQGIGRCAFRPDSQLPEGDRPSACPSYQSQRGSNAASSEWQSTRTSGHSVTPCRRCPTRWSSAFRRPVRITRLKLELQQIASSVGHRWQFRLQAVILRVIRA